MTEPGKIEQPNEMVKTAMAIQEWEAKKNHALSCMENDNRVIAEADQNLVHLVNKMSELGKRITYGKPEVTKTGTVRKSANPSKLDETLGKIVYRQGAFSIRQKFIDYVMALPYIDKNNAVRFLINGGLKESTAKATYPVIVKYFSSKGWLVGAHHELRKPV